MQQRNHTINYERNNSFKIKCEKRNITYQSKNQIKAAGKPTQPPKEISKDL